VLQTVIMTCLNSELLLSNFLIQLIAALVMAALGFVIISLQIRATDKRVAAHTETVVADATLLSELENNKGVIS